ncbi:MAG TPA: hypothetical protein VER38_05755 [Candidatus Eisenbacteria bacterium]|nr:hypothetical protein [Candidatus Eisenbacteria bacterium]
MRSDAGKGSRARAVISIGLAVAALGGAAESRAANARPAMPSKTYTIPGKTYTWTFQADTLGQKPAHSVAFGGTWSVSVDSTGSASSAARDSAAATAGGPADSARQVESAPLPPRLLSQSEGDDGIAYHYLTFTRPLLQDLDASVRFRIRSGEMDPSAGLLFQMDPKGTSGYLVRVSGKSGEMAFHYLLYGKRRDVKYAKIDPPALGTWHTIAVKRRGSVLRAFYDGKELLETRDDRFSKGTVGVWGEDDTLVDFADLTATAR